MNNVSNELAVFLATWVETEDGNKQGFMQLQALLAGFAGVQLTFHPRPGLTYSLRAAISGHSRPLFTMIDVIEDQPRWLSVCFFADMAQDPEERGAFVPGGLLGEDALCFDLELCSAEALAYVTARLAEAYQAAVGG
jgi:hypothetical protein